MRIALSLSLLWASLVVPASLARVSALPEPTAASAAAPPAVPAWSYPIGIPGRPLGAGFWVRDGFGVENTWYTPGDWHTGEDWYAQTDDTAGANVYAVAAGAVVYAGANYPGRVVIVEHAGELFSMYGHLDPALAVKVGQQLARGQLIGTVHKRADRTPSHLHFEIRTFLTTRVVNGAAPRYGYRCGRNCPPGPGYWPIDAPELPGAVGWLNPTHVIARRGVGALPAAGAARPIGAVVVAAQPASASAQLWPRLSAAGAPQGQPTRLTLTPDEQLDLLQVWVGPDAPRATSAAAYGLWYRVRLPDGSRGWLQAAVPSTADTGADGRPSSIMLTLVPAQEAP